MDEPDPIFQSFPAALGRYRILKRLGKGGMRAVYLAEDSKYRNRPTAIKIPTKAAGGVSEDRFLREAEVSRVLDHPNICRVYDVGVVGNRHYMTMKFVPGTDLTSFVGKGKLWPVERALPLVVKLTEAFQYAHDHGVFHRDIKPANVMLMANDEPVVMDFGLARVEGDTTLSVSGAMLGTVYYMPLEQALGRHKTIGPHSDVYSLGVVLFELLSGERPFTGESRTEILMRLGNEPTPPLRSVLPEADPQLEAILLKAMAKSWQDRYPTMRAFAAALLTLPVTLSSPPAGVQSEPYSPSVPPDAGIHVPPPPQGRWKTKCPGCASVLKFASDRAGKAAKCPKCGGALQLPAADRQGAVWAPSDSTNRGPAPKHSDIRRDMEEYERLWQTDQPESGFKDRARRRFKAWHRAAEGGDIDAMFLTARACHLGIGSTLSYNAYREAARKYQNPAGARGAVFEPQALDAIKWYRKAASEGHVIAMYTLGILLHTIGKQGNPYEDEVSWRELGEAKIWLDRAALQGVQKWIPEICIRSDYDG